MRQLDTLLNFSLSWVLGAVGYIVFELSLSGGLFAGSGDLMLTAFLIGIAVGAVLTFVVPVRFLSGRGIERLVGFYALALMVIVAIDIVADRV